MRQIINPETYLPSSSEKRGSPRRISNDVFEMLEGANQRTLRAIVVLDNFDHDEVLFNWLKEYERRDCKIELSFDVSTKRICHVCGGEHHGEILVCSCCRDIYRNNPQLRERVRARY